MKKQLLLIVLLGFTCMTYAQIITIKDQQTGQPIELATISSDNPKTFATTNADGQADVSKFEGAKLIEIRSLGYSTIVLSYNELESERFNILLEISSLSMDEVVISASRWRQTSGNIPEKVATITPKEVALQNPQTAADLLKISGKVFIQKSQQGGGSPMIRGFATNRLLYTIDGVRMNTAIFRGGNIQNVISLDPFAIENTEVLFGPNSVIYGSDAIGGVMSFQTLTPQLSISDSLLVSGKGVARYSSANDEKTGHFDINVGWKKWAFVTSITSNDYGDLLQGSHGPEDYLKPYYVQRQDSVDVAITQDDERLQTPSGFSQINMMQKVRYKPNENWNFQYGFHYSETSPYGRFDRTLRTRDGLPRYGEWKYGPQKWMLNNFSFTNYADSPIYDEMTVRLAYQYFEESRISRDFNSIDRETRLEEVDAYSANVDFLKQTSAKNELFYGLEVVYNDVTSIGTNTDISTGVDVDGPSRYPESSWASYAAYVSDHYQVSDKVMLSGGLRYNLYTLDATFDTRFFPFPFTTADINDGALTGSVGAVYRPDDTWVLKANTSTAFRSPNIDDVGKVFDSEPGSVTVPNPDLEAEYAYNADVSVAKVFSNRVKVDVSAYYTHLDNALVRRDFTLSGMDSIVYDGELSQVQAIQNAAVAKVYGIQAGIEVKLPQGFSLSSDLSYQKGEEELDDGTESPSRHASPLFGVTRLNFSRQKFNLQFYVDYQAERKFEDLAVEERGKVTYALDENGNSFSPSWYTLNFKGSYQLSEDLTLFAGLENLTDQRYRPYSSGISAPGRNFILSLRANL